MLLLLTAAYKSFLPLTIKYLRLRLEKVKIGITCCFALVKTE